MRDSVSGGDVNDGTKTYFFPQCTGSRFPLLSIAQSLGLTGWVENLWDGRVEMEVQGSEASIREMFSDSAARWINVTNMGDRKRLLVKKNVDLK